MQYKKKQLLHWQREKNSYFKSPPISDLSAAVLSFSKIKQYVKLQGGKGDDADLENSLLDTVGGKEKVG